MGERQELTHDNGSGSNRNGLVATGDITKSSRSAPGARLSQERKLGDAAAFELADQGLP
jgi:hypothetical protein